MKINEQQLEEMVSLTFLQKRGFKNFIDFISLINNEEERKVLKEEYVNNLDYEAAALIRDLEKKYKDL